MSPTCSLRKLFAVFAIAVVALFARPASASETVRGAVHRGAIEGETIVWRSQFHFGEGQTSVRLASPLLTGSRVEKSADVEIIDENGEIVGFSSLVPPARSIKVVIQEPFHRAGDRVRLTPPLAEGDAVQIVDASGPGGLHFEPAPATTLDRRVGYYASPGFAKHGRAERDASLAYRKRQAGDLPLYLRVTPALAAGIDGTLSTESMRSRTGVIGAAVIFVGMIAALGVAYRRVADAARLEHAERTLEAEFTRLDAV